VAAKKVAKTVEQKLTALKAKTVRLKTKAKAAAGDAERKLRKGVRRAQRKARSLSAAMKKGAKAVKE
jgi:hypothetical protein